MDRQLLVERHLMSHEHASNPDGKGLLVTAEEVVSIMVNEEDHLRIQVMRSGLNLSEAWDIINAIDDALGSELAFCFFTKLGIFDSLPDEYRYSHARKCDDAFAGFGHDQANQQGSDGDFQIEFRQPWVLWRRNTSFGKFLSNIQSSSHGSQRAGYYSKYQWADPSGH